MTNELEFDARVSSDGRDVWPTGLAVHQPTGNICVVDRDNARVKVRTRLSLDLCIAPLRGTRIMGLRDFVSQQNSN